MNFLKKALLLLTLLCLCISCAGCRLTAKLEGYIDEQYPSSIITDVVNNPPEYYGFDYVTVNNNVPEFNEKELVARPFEKYSELDELGRSGVAFACVGVELMPTAQREDINEIRPSGWHSIMYEFIEGRYLYNRCHLIAFQLTAEGANSKNLFTGTRHLNNNVMAGFENYVSDYVKQTKNHVLYRVTPVFIGDNLLASGVQIEAYSIEDNGKGVCFNIYCFNVQDGVTIDYTTGDSKPYDYYEVSEKPQSFSETKQIYVICTETKTYHLPDCSETKDLNATLKRNYTGIKSNLNDIGLSPCEKCDP